MLVSLSLRHFILAQSLDINFAQGFGVLTGETGAGKSILLDALQCVTGARAEVSMIREGAERAEVSALFHVPAHHPLWTRLDEWSIEQEPDILLRRVLERGGRSRAYINGSTVTVAQLAEVGEALLDIHGQHDSMKIMRAHAQRALLDEGAGAHSAVELCQKSWQEWQSAQVAWQNAQSGQQQRAEKRDYLLMRRNDLADIADETSWQEINREHQKLSHTQQLQALTASAMSALENDGGSEGSIDAQLIALRQTFAKIQDIDSEASPIAGLIESAHHEIEEAIRALRHYAGRIDGEPQRLIELEEKIRHQMDCARKYREKPEHLAGLRAQTERELESLDEHTDIEGLAKKMEQAQKRFHEVAQVLSTQRSAAAQTLSEKVTAHLPALGMKNGGFNVRLSPAPAGPFGEDAVEFQVRGLSGQAWMPLAKVVSGGELSRISLALFLANQSTLANTQAEAGTADHHRALNPALIEAHKTYVFDEVDAGIGGAVAASVGAMLFELARTRGGGQILCVTHLPQVAACAHWHALVKKSLGEQGQAVSSVDIITKAGRVDEIARMLGGKTITQATRHHAEEMLRLSQSPS